MFRNLPLVFHKRGFYYGYVVLFAGTVGVIASVPGQTMGVSVYTEHLINALGIDRLSLSLMYLFGTLTSSFILPYAGRVLDKLGSRFLAVIAASGLAISLVFLSNSDRITKLLVSLTKIDKVFIALPIIYLCFFGIRHFGQGQLTMASRTMMGRWFEKKRGLMLGLSGTFVAFGFGISPYVLNKLISYFSWRQSLYVLAASLALFALFAYIFYRRSPEHYGLTIDGGSEANEDEDSSNLATQLSFTANEAKRTFIFWVFNFGTATQAMLITAITFHIADIGALASLDSTTAFGIFIPVSIIAVVTELISGYLSDRLPLKYILSVMQAALTLALLGLQSFGSDFGYALVALGLGVSGGIFSLLTSAAWPKLFGRMHLGAIMGLVSAWMVAGSSIGPYFFSQGKSLTGDYSTILYISLIIPLSVFVASFFVTNPRRTN